MARSRGSNLLQPPYLGIAQVLASPGCHDTLSCISRQPRCIAPVSRPCCMPLKPLCAAPLLLRFLPPSPPSSPHAVADVPPLYPDYCDTHAAAPRTPRSTHSSPNTHAAPSLLTACSRWRRARTLGTWGSWQTCPPWKCRPAGSLQTRKQQGSWGDLLAPLVGMEQQCRCAPPAA